MYEFLESSELKNQAKRLLGYRTPLVLVIIVNLVLIVRIPMPSPRLAHAQNRGPHGQHADAVAFAPPELPGPDTAPPVPDAGTTQTASLEVNHSDVSLTGDSRSTPDGKTSLVLDVPDGTVLDVPGGTAGVQDNPTVNSIPSSPVPAAAHDVAQTQTIAQTIEPPPTGEPGTAGESASKPRATLAFPLAAWQRETQQFVQQWKTSARRILVQVRDRGEQALAHAHQAAEPVEPATQPVEDSPSTEAEISTPTVAHGTSSREPLVGNVATPNEGGFLVRNPSVNGGTVRLLVNQHLCELGPGEAHQFAPSDRWRIQFHRGGDFGDVQRMLPAGAYQFIVTPQGWELTPAADPGAQPAQATP